MSDFLHIRLMKWYNLKIKGGKDMALTYAVLGSGAMGLRFGLLLKEHLGA